MVTSSKDLETKIREIVEAYEVKNQSQLREILHDQGVSVNQSSISRALSRANIVKKAGIYALNLDFDSNLPKKWGEPNSIVFLKTNFAGPNMLVLRTAPGVASRAAYFIDHLDVAGVAGTIAGDDTIFVAIVSEVSGETVLRNIKTIFE